MTARSLSDTIGRRLWAAGIAFALAAALVAAMFLTSSGSPANASVSATASTLDTALATDTPSEDRARLKADLTKARALEGEARKAAVRKIRSDAAAGAYGEKVANGLDRRGDRRAAVIALLPDELQSDLKALRAAPADDRKAMRDDIRQKALDGGYGEKVRTAADRLKDRWSD